MEGSERGRSGSRRRALDAVEGRGGVSEVVVLVVGLAEAEVVDVAVDEEGVEAAVVAVELVGGDEAAGLVGAVVVAVGAATTRSRVTLNAVR